MNQSEIDRLAKIIWDYHHLNHQLEKADAILVLGSIDTRVAERGAQLYLDGWAPLIIFAGGFGRLTKGKWDEAEADKFAKIAIKMGVPKDKVLIENKSTNTGENIKFAQKILEFKGLAPKSIIIVTKPYMERRAWATAKKYWPDKKLIVTSPPSSFEEDLKGGIDKEEVINVVVGDLQRLKIYPEKGFQIAQDIPAEVWQAYEKLVAAGFDKQLVE